MKPQHGSTKQYTLAQSPWNRAVIITLPHVCPQCTTSLSCVGRCFPHDIHEPSTHICPRSTSRFVSCSYKRVKGRSHTAEICIMSHACAAYWVAVPGGRPPDDRVHTGASLYTCVMCALTCLTQLRVQLCVGLLCLPRGFIALEFELVSLGLHCFLRLSSAGLLVLLVPGCTCCWAYSAHMPWVWVHGCGCNCVNTHPVLVLLNTPPSHAYTVDDRLGGL